MKQKQFFEQFCNGYLNLPQHKLEFNTLEWHKHAIFEGVDLKHIVTSQHSQGEFSFHLVRISPHKKIGLHCHEKQLETHEVIAGSGVCLLADSTEIKYAQGTVTILPKCIAHEIIAEEDGLYLFAKFFPALC